MDHDFWHNRWQEGRIGFHQDETNTFLLQYWAEHFAGCNTVFVPLCGKSKDMCWLHEQGTKVIGVELNDSACKSFFQENFAGEVFDEWEDGAFYCRRNDEIVLMSGDFFQLDSVHLKGVEAVYDRAALIALPEGMRKDYAATLIDLLPKGTPVLLVTLEFESEGDKPQGPPFSVKSAELERLFGEHYQLQELHRENYTEGRDAGRSEVVWLLSERG